MMIHFVKEPHPNIPITNNSSLKMRFIVAKTHSIQRHLKNTFISLMETKPLLTKHIYQMPIMCLIRWWVFWGTKAA